VETAIDLFTRGGVRRTSIDEIAVAADVGKGSVYLEFRGKDELFRAAVEEVVRELLARAEAAAAREGPLIDRVTEILLAKFWRLYELVHARPHARELIDAKDAVAVDVLRAADDRYAALLAAALTAAVGRGEWRPTPPHAPATIAAVLLRAAHGTGYGGGAGLTAAAFRRRLRLAVELILAGASAPPSAARAAPPPPPRSARRPRGR
jgi:AcrR family transcriptional regulator